jgi:hypothetical protein
MKQNIYLKTDPFQQIEATEVFNGIGGMDCIELERRHGYLYLHGNRNMSGPNGMFNRIKTLIEICLQASADSCDATKVIDTVTPFRSARMQGLTKVTRLSTRRLVKIQH